MKSSVWIFSELSSCAIGHNEKFIFRVFLFLMTICSEARHSEEGEAQSNTVIIFNTVKKKLNDEILSRIVFLTHVQLDTNVGKST